MQVNIRRTPSLAAGYPFHPTGTADGTRLNALIVAIAALGTGIPIQLMGGTYDIDTAVLMVSGTIIHAHQDARWTTDSGHPVESLLRLVSSQAAFTAESSLTADVVIGSRVVYLANAVDVGKELCLIANSGLQQLWYTVTACEGSSSPYTITLERPVRAPFVSGNTVRVYNQSARVRGARFLGNGMTIDAAHCTAFPVEGIGNSRCEVSGITIINSPAAEGVQFDTGCDFPVFRNVHTINSSIGFYSAESPYAENCHGVSQADSINCGFGLWDCIDPILVGCSTSKAGGYGCLLATNGGTWGTSNAVFVDCHFDGSHYHGIYAVAAHNVTIIGGGCDRNQGNGITTDLGCTGTVSLHGCVMSRNGGGGIAPSADCPATYTGDVRVEANVSWGVNLMAPATLTVTGTDGNCVLVNATASGSVLNVNLETAGTCVAVVGAHCSISGKLKNPVSSTASAVLLAVSSGAAVDASLELSQNCQAGSWPVQLDAGSSLNMSGRFTYGTSAIFGILVNGSSILDLHHFTVVNRTSAYAVRALTGGCVRLGACVDLGAAADGYIPGEGGHISPVDVSLNGTTPVAIPWPALKANERVSVVRKTAGGTAQSALPPTWVPTPGTGLSIVSATVNANDTYQVTIG
jgi:hypothetical protein